MGTQNLLIFFAVVVQFCNVLGKHNFYEYYYSRHHKGHSSTTESIHLSTSDITSSEYEPETSTSDDNWLQNNQYEPTGDTSLQNHKYEPTVYSFDDFTYEYTYSNPSLKIGVIVAGIVIFITVLGCLFCCIRFFCSSRKERRGFIVASQLDAAREEVPQQSAPVHQPPEFQQPYPAQCYGDHSQLFPAQYQPQPMQQFQPMQPHFQYSPSAPMGCHNPPEAPPPYEFPEKF